MRIDKIGRLLDIILHYNHMPTYMHCKRVSLGTNFIYEKMTDINPKDKTTAHDIGKIGISDFIIEKPTSLNENEILIAQCHTEIGEHILRKVSDEMEIMWEHTKSSLLYRSIVEHHEHFDGNGYPRGLCEGEISLIGRIVSVIDVLDALLENRAYRDALNLEVAVEYIRKRRNTQFDPVIVDFVIKNLHSLLYNMQIEIK